MVVGSQCDQVSGHEILIADLVRPIVIHIMHCWGLLLFCPNLITEYFLRHKRHGTLEVFEVTRHVSLRVSRER